MSAAIYCLVVSSGSLKTFNQYNRWETVGSITDLTSALVLSKGFLYSNLTTSYTNIYLKYTQIQTYDDGSIVYQSEDVTATMNPISVADYTAADGTELLQVTVPPFTIKDGIASDEYIVAYSSDGTFVPLIQNVVFSSATTHKTSVGFNFDTIYNFDTKLKYRIQVNSKGYGNWSPLQDPFNKFNALISYSALDMGPNTITIQVANDIETITNSLVINSAITMENGQPSIAIISADTNNFKIHFKIIDPDSDSVQYKITLSNSKNTSLLLSDWSILQPSAVDIIYYIDTTNVVANEINMLKIDYKDEFGTTGTYTYTFTGQYRNIVFLDENNQYYTTDKGVLLKLLMFDKILSGAQSDVRPIKIQNNNNTAITNLIMNTHYTTNVNGVKVLLCKNNNPFIGSENLDFGDEIINIGDSKTIYVMIDSSLEAEGLCKFDIDVNAQTV